MTQRAGPIEIHYWVLTSASLITTSSVSVAEDYYINKAAQVLKGRVVKTPRLWGVILADCEAELNITNETKKILLEHCKKYNLYSLESSISL